MLYLWVPLEAALWVLPVGLVGLQGEVGYRRSYRWMGIMGRQHGSMTVNQYHPWWPAFVNVMLPGYSEQRAVIVVSYICILRYIGRVSTTCHQGR